MFLIDQKKKKLLCGRTLVERYIKATGNTNASMPDVARWFMLHVAPYRKSSTFHKYKNALLSLIDDIAVHYECSNIMKKRPPRSGDHMPRRTSARRAKRISPTDLAMLQEHGIASRSKWSDMAIDWLIAGIATGLRPHEWVVVELDTKSNTLNVLNIKLMLTVPDWGKTYRKIPLGHLSPEQLNAVYATLGILKDIDPVEYDKTYRGVKQWLCNANIKLWKRRKTTISLMSGRHQFCANLKQSKLTFSEIAYLMGHCTDERAFSTYGPSRYGDGIDIASQHISKEALNKVRKKMAKHHPDMVDKNEKPKAEQIIQSGVTDT